MNRADRRRAARSALRGKGFRGTQKQAAVRELAAALRGVKPVEGVPHDSSDEVVGGTQDVAVSRRKSGLYAVRKKGFAWPKT